MSLFFEHKCGLPPTATDVVCESWSTSGETALLAVATKDGHVRLFHEEGDPVLLGDSSSESVELVRAVNSAVNATTVAWQTSLPGSASQFQEPVLAIGWDDGAVSLWSHSMNQLATVDSGHEAALSLLCWSPEGSRLITGDESGRVSVWKINQSSHNKMALARVVRYTQTAGAIELCVFRAATQSQSSSQDHDNNDSSGPPAPPSCPSFFLGGDAGRVWFADDLGHCSEVVNVGGPLGAMFFSASKDYLVCVSRDAVLFRYQVHADGKIEQVSKVKLSIKGTGRDLRVIWAGPGLLAAANAEQFVRLWHLEQDESYILPLSDPRLNAAAGDSILCVDFSAQHRMLVAGTQQGRVLMWRFTGPLDGDSVAGSPDHVASEADWEVMPPVPSRLTRGITSCVWSRGHTESPCLAVTTKDQVTSLVATVLHCRLAHEGQVAVAQLAVDKLALHTKTGKTRKCSTGIRVKGLDVASDGSHMVVWNRTTVEVHYVDTETGQAKLKSTFASSARDVILHGADSLLLMCSLPDNNTITVTNHQGVAKRALPFSAELDGRLAAMALSQSADVLCAVTHRGLLRMWSLKHREPRLIVPGRRCQRELTATQAPASHLQVHSVQVNCDGTKVSILCHQIDASTGVRQPHTNLYVYDVDRDKIDRHEFAPTFYPSAHFWDKREPKLLCCERTRLTEIHTNTSSSSDASSSSSSSSREICTLFATPDRGVLLQDSMPLHTDALLGLDAPKLFCVSRPDLETVHASGGDRDEGEPMRLGVAKMPTSMRRTKFRLMRDFLGLDVDQIDDATRHNLLNFSYHLTTGNMDEAYRAVKTIQGGMRNGSSIWENMAIQCVQTRRLDVAEVCLGNMRSARGARALRLAKKRFPDEPRCQVAAVAIELGLMDEAVALYREAGRFDLLAKLHQASNNWSAAVTECEANDRIHLKTTHHRYAQYLEQKGDTKQAVEHYEHADTHRREVPRMLYSSAQQLEQYVTQRGATDQALLSWWAQYCESNQRYPEACTAYEQAHEWLSLVRVHCYRGEWAEAEAVVQRSQSEAAAYHLARQFETQEDEPRKAIRYFELANRHHHAIKLAKQHDMQAEVLRLALEAPAARVSTHQGLDNGNKNSADSAQGSTTADNTAAGRIKLDGARYFEQQGELEKAVQLYQKGGDLARAVELCFEAQLFDSLRNIADDLGPDTDPALLARCGDFFMEHDQFAKAVTMYTLGGQADHALDICVRHGVRIDEAAAEKMTPPRPPASAGKEAKATRVTLLRKLAKALKDQKSFHLATKKYTQAGDRVRAIKCLIKSGDTAKIIYYAQKTRKKEVYMLAANYLQALDWHSTPDVMKAIINFYTLAKALEQLAYFYDACAAVEIDEFRDYEKALGALKEALKYIIKAKQMPEADRQAKLSTLDQRIRLCEQFVEARKLVKTDPAQCVALCRTLLQQPPDDVEQALRVGDVFALLIEYHHANAHWDDAKQLICEMADRGIVISPYLDRNMVQRIYQQTGVAVTAASLEHGPPGHGQNQQQQQQQEAPHATQEPLSRDSNGGYGSEIEDDIAEEFDEDIPDEF